MTQEDKELLLKDLCARLPYEVKINVNGEEDTLLELGVDTGWVNASYDIDGVKPYLRPMSNMTKEERRKLCNIRPCYINSDDIVNGTQCNNFIQASECQDWLNAHHFDYRGLIPMGLALEAPEGMYK